MAIAKGEKLLTARQQKQQVMKWAGWSSKQYEREYDKLRNRVRNYERANGFERGSINAADLLAREARNQYYAPRYGQERRPTTLYEAVMQTTSQSTGAKLTEPGRTRSQMAAIAGIEARYHGLLSKSELVRESVEELKQKNPNFTAAELERRILDVAHVSNALTASARMTREHLLKKGIITKEVDTL